MIVETLLACEVKGLLDVLVVGIEAQDTRDERAVGAVAAVGMGKGVPQAKGDLGDAPSSRLAATWAQRRAPAVCDELGPTMTGPKISNAEVVASVCGLPAMLLLLYLVVPRGGAYSVPPFRGLWYLVACSDSPARTEPH